MKQFKEIDPMPEPYSFRDRIRLFTEAIEDSRVEEIVNAAQKLYPVTFKKIVEVHQSDLVSTGSCQIYRNTKLVLSFIAIDTSIVLGDLVLLNKSFEISEEDHCSGWLEFRDARFSEPIRLVRKEFHRTL